MIRNAVSLPMSSGARVLAFLVVALCFTANAEAQIATGTYTGTDALQSITGLGFQPDIVIIKADRTSIQGLIRTSTMTGTKGISGTASLEAGLITSLDADGFTVTGNDTRVNSALNCTGACTYYWAAIKANANITLSTYTGNGTLTTDTQDITGVGFSVDYLIIIPQGTQRVRHRTRYGGTTSNRIVNAGNNTDTIPALGADGFTVQVGTDSQEDMNASGDTYHYIAFNNVAGSFQTGSYLGDGSGPDDVTGVGFQPELVFVQSYDSDYDTFHKSDKMAGNLSMEFRNELNTNRITALLPDGFQVGGYTGVNDSGVNYNYVAFNDPATPLYRSVGSNAGDLNTSSRTVAISGTIATFSGPMPDDVGVGDVLQYGSTYIAFIHGRLSDTVYTVKSANGGIPQSASAGTAVGVYRAYTSLNNWETQDENDSLDDSVEDFDTSKNLINDKTAMRVACYGDGADNAALSIFGWNTGPDNDIKIYTPYETSEVGASQRHNGRWDTSAYRLVTSNATGILVQVPSVEIDGLQIYINGVSAADQAAIYFYTPGNTLNGEGTVSNCILRGISTATTNHFGTGFYSVDTFALYVYNNIIYDFRGDPWNHCLVADDAESTLYAYNNTLHNCNVGIENWAGTVVAKNNLAYSNVDNYDGTFDLVNSTNNLSGPGADVDCPNCGTRDGVTVTFVNEAGDDFHLDSGDAGARNYGANLAGDAVISFPYDIDGEQRDSVWDIGADERPAIPVFYSVGTDSGNLESGSPTIDISGGVATFSEAQPANIGVGDEITYGGSTKVYISSRLSSTDYGVLTATGAVPGNVVGATVNSVKRAFNLLSAAETGSADINHLNTQDLAANDYQLNWVCYNDDPDADPTTGMDDTVAIDTGWITGPTTYIRIFTPRAPTEVGVTQRHSGTAGTGFRLKPVSSATQSFNVIYIQTGYVRIEGIEIDGTSLTSSTATRGILTMRDLVNVGDIRIDSMIIHDLHTTQPGVTAENSIGILDYHDDAGEGPPLIVTNNIIYDITNDQDFGHIAGIHIGARGTSYVYNNTVYRINNHQGCAGDCGPSWGIYAKAWGGGSVTAIAKNNYAGDVTGKNPNVYCYGTTDGGVLTQSYNVSSDASASGTGSQTGMGAPYTNYFQAIADGSEDLHIKADSLALWGSYAENLSSVFTNDIDGSTRQAPWDIGADEYGAGNCLYSYRKTLTIDHQRVGSSCGSDVANFPVLINLVDPDLRTTANGGHVAHPSGYDIVFRLGVMNLDFEIEQYDGSNGTLVAWVRIPSLSYTADTSIDLIYGNGCVVSSPEVPTGVWDSNFLAVWHLKEDPSGTAPQLKDSTLGGQHATTGGTMLTNDQVPGQIGGSIDFDGGDDFAATGANNLLANRSTYTLSAWVRPRAVQVDFAGIVDYDGNADGSAWEAILEISSARRPWGGVWTTTDWEIINATAVLPTTGWSYLTTVYDGSNVTVYIDGALDATSAAITGNVRNNNRTVDIGRNEHDGRYFDGIIDEVRISDAPRGACWIETEYNNHYWPIKSDSPTCSDVNGFICIGAELATAVDLVSFEAKGLDEKVELTWETGSEIDNLGFHLYRSLSASGPYERITSALIPGLGSSPEGKRYSYTDTGLTNGVTYYYKLEDIETTGKAEEHGPVGATPQAVEEPGGEEPGGEEEPSSGSRHAVGQPERNRLNILESRTGELVLELITEGFYAIPQDDGTVRLEIPEFALAEDVGSPAVPVKRTWVPVLAGRQVTLVSVSTFDEEVFSDLLPETAGAPAIEVGRGGTIRATRQRRQRVTNRVSTYYPEQSAQLLATAFQEDVKKALVEMAPLRWDTARNRLVLAHRLVVRLSLEGRDLAEQTSRSGRRGRRYPRPPTLQEPGRVMTRWVTTEAGLYGVDLRRLLRSRDGAPINPDTLRLSRQGQSVPFHIEGTTLYFVSVGGEGNPFGHEAVYELEVGVRGERMPVSSAVPGGAPTAYYWELIRKEEDLIYQSALVQAPDRWLWKMLFAPAKESFSFDVSALASTTESSQLKVWLQGASDFAANPDHHVQVYVNGTFLGERSWNGKEAQELDLEIGAGILHDGENLLEVENVDDTDATYSMVMLNRFEVRYPRHLEAQDGYLEGSWSQSGTAEVTGVAPQAHVLEKTPTGFIRLEGAEATVEGIRFQTEADRSYLVVSPDAVRTPTTRRVSKTNRLKTTSQQADYVLIGPREFLGAASPLLELRRSQGLKAKAVAIEDITSEFGFGEESPQALKDFLTYAYHSWDPGPRYVVLAGDGTYDFKDNLKTGVENQVPPMMVMTSYLETASDPAYAAVNGEDLLPDLAIGRLPAATVEELQGMVAKIVSFESSGKTFGGRAVLVSDNPDRAGDFVADAEALASTALSTRELAKIYLSQLGTTETRNQVQQAFNDGASLMNYIGHGGIQLWADEDIFNNDDVGTLALQGEQPLLLTMNCLNGYFHFPYLNALSEELLKADGKGAVAAFSPSGLSVNSAAHIFHRLLLEELVNGGHSRLGDAVLAAQSAYADSGALPEMIAIYHLFGDPAMRVQ